MTTLPLHSSLRHHWVHASAMIPPAAPILLSLVAGFLTRFTAGNFMLIMLGAIATAHWPKGFFMNWFGQQQGEGFEYHLLVIGMSAALLIAGGGKWRSTGSSPGGSSIGLTECRRGRAMRRNWSRTQVGPCHAAGRRIHPRSNEPALQPARPHRSVGTVEDDDPQTIAGPGDRPCRRCEASPLLEREQ